jgi:hypothetical protein
MTAALEMSVGPHNCEMCISEVRLFLREKVVGKSPSGRLEHLDY